MSSNYFLWKRENWSVVIQTWSWHGEPAASARPSGRPLKKGLNLAGSAPQNFPQSNVAPQKSKLGLPNSDSRILQLALAILAWPDYDWNAFNNIWIRHCIHIWPGKKSQAGRNLGVRVWTFARHFFLVAQVPPKRGVLVHKNSLASYQRCCHSVEPRALTCPFKQSNLSACSCLNL